MPGRSGDHVQEIFAFLGGLEFTLSKGVNDEKRNALRRCLQGLVVDKGNGKVTLSLRKLPMASAEEVQTVTVPLWEARAANSANPRGFV